MFATYLYFGEIVEGGKYVVLSDSGNQTPYLVFSAYFPIAPPHPQPLILHACFVYNNITLPFKESLVNCSINFRYLWIRIIC